MRGAESRTGVSPPDRLAEAIIFTRQAGSTSEDVAIREWQQRARQDDAKVSAYERLGWAYVSKARRTLDAGYYKLAEKTADAMDARFSPTDDSKLLRGHVLHNLHRFAGAEKIARELIASRGAPNDYALLSDALMEEGRLDEAVAALQKMVNLRPGLESYSRIAHIRWLKGDLEGATHAMEDAARAGSPRDAETYAWTLSQLSFFYLQAAQVPRALLIADSAAKYAPDYPPALLARGRALLAQGKNAEAVVALRRGAELNALPEYQWWLADALRLVGNEKEAAANEALIRQRGEAADPRTLALFLATRRQEPALALRLAREELLNRQDVLTHDAVSWAEATAGHWQEAVRESKLALTEHTLDGRLYLHAAEIARMTGDPAAPSLYEKAQTLKATLTPSEYGLLQAYSNNPRLAGLTPGPPSSR